MAYPDIHENARRCIAWSDRMIKRGWCGIVTEVLAEYMGESGNDYPTESALSKARDWEDDPSDMIDYIRKSGQWCMAPTWGCLHKDHKCPKVFLEDQAKGTP